MSIFINNPYIQIYGYHELMVICRYSWTINCSKNRAGCRYEMIIELMIIQYMMIIWTIKYIRMGSQIILGCQSLEHWDLSVFLGWIFSLMIQGCETFQIWWDIQLGTKGSKWILIIYWFDFALHILDVIFQILLLKTYFEVVVKSAAFFPLILNLIYSSSIGGLDIISISNYVLYKSIHINWSNTSYQLIKH